MQPNPVFVVWRCDIILVVMSFPSLAACLVVDAGGFLWKYVMELKALLKYEEPDFSVPNYNDFIFFAFKSLSRNKTCQNMCLRDMFSL